MPPFFQGLVDGQKLMISHVVVDLSGGELQREVGAGKQLAMDAKSLQ